MPPSIRGTPQRRSKRPKVEAGVAIRRSHQRASSKPPARHQPSIAAIAGFDGRQAGGAHRAVGVVDVEVERLQVGAGAEGLPAGAGEDEHPRPPGRPRSRARPCAKALARRRRRSRCGARAGRWSAARPRRPARSGPRLLIAGHPPTRLAVCVRSEQGAGGLVAASSRGSPATPGSPKAPRSRAVEGRCSTSRPPRLGRGSDGAVSKSGTKKRPGMTLVACLARSLRARSSFAPPIEIGSPAWLPQGSSLSRSQGEPSALAGRARKGCPRRGFRKIRNKGCARVGAGATSVPRMYGRRRDERSGSRRPGGGRGATSC